jgi:hypothetical protein
MKIYSDFYPVPNVFWCFETGKMFRRCRMCDIDLMIEGTNYLIEKAFRKKEVIFEYAMCFDCVQQMRGSLSVQSRKLINNYFHEHVDIEERKKTLIGKYGRRTRSWISKCMIKGTPISKCEEHQIYGWFIDKDIVFTGLPYMLSGEVIDELLHLLSNETIGVLDDFSKKLFDIDIPKGLILV